MTNKTVIIILLFIPFDFYSSISAQPELYSFLSGKYYDDISIFAEILKNEQIEKITEKRGYVKNIYEFDTLEQSITITEKLYQLKTFVDKVWIKDSLIERRSFKWLRRDKSETTIDYFYNQIGDTLFTYNVFSSDTILKGKSFYDKESNAKINYIYMPGPAGVYNEFFTVKSYYDGNNNKIKETLRDTTYYNNGFLLFEGNYSNKDNIIFEKCSTNYHSQPVIDLTVEYEYKLNKCGDWIKKYYQRSDNEKKYKIIRRIRYY
jgi:hypothetical protein